MSTNLIQSDPSIMMGKPVIAGTRITVELILEKFAAGETIEDLLLEPGPGPCRGYSRPRSIPGRAKAVPGLTVDRVQGTVRRLVYHGWMIRC